MTPKEFAAKINEWARAASRGRPGMKLASKIFLASSLVIVVLFIVGGLSLRAVGRLVSVNRDITTRTMPAIRDASSIHAAMPGLARLEARMLILRDPRYVSRWEEQTVQARDDLARLGSLLTAPRQEALLRQARDAFDEYQRLVGEEQALLARGQREQALRLSETETRALIERVESLLDQLIEQIRSAALGAQAEAARLEARTWSGVLIAFGAAVVLALAGTAAIAFRLTWSLRALSAATSAMATGSFPEPVRVEGQDEVAALARSFNAMAKQLRELDALKETFLATVSHELRSPLTSMREAAHLLRDEVPGGLNPKQARLVKIIEEGSERLLRLVNQILDLSRLRAGTLPLERKPLELDRLVARAVEGRRHRPRAADRARSGGGPWRTCDGRVAGRQGQPVHGLAFARERGRVSRFVWGATMAMLLAGCAPWWPPATLLDRADRLVQKGDYASAVRTYDELLAKYPDDPSARRALVSRDAVAGLLAARADIARLREELASRDGELNRLRQELERLREDLENLKRLDLRDERRRK